MTETYCDRHSHERIKEQRGSVVIPFYDENLELLSKDVIDFEYIEEEPGIIKITMCSEPSDITKKGLKRIYWNDDIREAIHIETGKELYGEICYIKK